MYKKHLRSLAHLPSRNGNSNRISGTFQCDDRSFLVSTGKVTTLWYKVKHRSHHHLYQGVAKMFSPFRNETSIISRSSYYRAGSGSLVTDSLHQPSRLICAAGCFPGHRRTTDFGGQPMKCLYLMEEFSSVKGTLSSVYFTSLYSLHYYALLVWLREHVICKHIHRKYISQWKCFTPRPLE